MNLGFSDQVVIVTGGSRGIGRATAQAFLDEGARVMISSIRRSSVEETVRELSPLGRVEGIPADVANEKDVVRLVEETGRRLGPPDVMVANAGIGGEVVNLADMPVEEWDRMMAVHLRGTFLCGREAARAMRAAGRKGRIVTIASSASYQCDPGSGHYNTAKTGMLGLTRSLAVDLSEWGIRVNSVAPGWVRTDMTENDIPPAHLKLQNCGVMPRVGEPVEIARAILFLASEGCAFMTGATLVIDGGQIIVAPKAYGVEAGP